MKKSRSPIARKDTNSLEATETRGTKYRRKQEVKEEIYSGGMGGLGSNVPVVRLFT